MVVDTFEKARLGLSPVGAEKVTVTPDNRFPPTSVTVATSGFAKLVPISVLWPLPLVNVMFAGTPGMFVRLKAADTLPAVAVTVYEPALLLAVKVPELASPELLVVAEIVPVELENVPLCSLLPGSAVKVTGNEGITTELASLTVPNRAVANALLMVVD